MNRFTTMAAACFVVLSAGFAVAIDSATAPRPVPLTRPEMKEYLEDMKGRKPRIPLPELTAADIEQLGERATSYESRLRFHYLPPRDGRSDRRRFGGLGRDSDPEMSLDYAFKTQLFWIVSRTNNCQYCLGHQESKLLAAGMAEDNIAALDCDWSLFTPAQQAAFDFARKITYEPHNFGDADIDQLREHFTELQILEMILSVAGNNSINRWKEGAGIPQSHSGGNFGRRSARRERITATQDAPALHTYLTPTAEQYLRVITKVAPLAYDEKSGEATRLTVSSRPALESRTEVEAALQTARSRTSRLPLVDEAQVKELLPTLFTASPAPNWARLLANFPRSAADRIERIRLAEQGDDLSPLLKAQVSWIIARQDRAWYAVAESQRRLQELGWSSSEIFRLDGSWDDFSPAERALFTVARKLAAAPVVLTDADVDQAVEQVGARDVVQLISYTTDRASFDRITEAAGLQAEN